MFICYLRINGETHFVYSPDESSNSHLFLQNDILLYCGFLQVQCKVQLMRKKVLFIHIKRNRDTKQDIYINLISSLMHCDTNNKYFMPVDLGKPVLLNS